MFGWLRCKDNIDKDIKEAPAPHFEFTPQERAYQQGVRERVACGALQAIGQWQPSSQQKTIIAREVAFDDELEKLTALLREGVDVESQDTYGNSLLSEAAAGGAEHCVQMLLARGANPNRLGRYHRTPLWRAANAGHGVVVGILLRGGADPRITDENATRPGDVANDEDSKMLLECWDIRVTDKLQRKRRASLPKHEREQIEKEEKQKEELASALEEVQRKVIIAKAELTEKREIVLSYAHQLRECQDDQGSGQDLQIHIEREQAGLQILLDLHRVLQWEESKVRLRQRDFASQLERRRLNEIKTTERVHHASESCHADVASEEFSSFDAVVELKALQSVLATDFHGNRKEDGRWPMFYDPSGRVRVFFDHSGAIVFDALELRRLQFSEDKNERRRLKLALLKQLRYGGQVVIDLGGDLSNMCFVEEAFNAISPALFSLMMDRAVLFSYLLPQRFRSWSHCDLGPNESLDLDFDETGISKFVLSFIVKNASQEKQEVNVTEGLACEDSHDDGWLLVEGNDTVEELSAYYTVRVLLPDA